MSELFNEYGVLKKEIVVKQLCFEEFAHLYCETQVCEPDELRQRLQSQHAEYKCEGWFLSECQMFDSTSFRNRVIVPFGPNNSFKQIPNHPFSPRGLASDTSVVIAWMPAGKL
jgi:hypothetical protein